MRAGGYFPSIHFRERLEERRVTMADVRHAIACALRAETYDCPPRHGGTCWRVAGADMEGEPLCIGVEAYLDVATRQKIILCTVL